MHDFTDCGCIPVLSMLTAIRIADEFGLGLTLDHRMGSLKEGKDADLVIYDGNSLEIASKVKYTFIKDLFLLQLLTKIEGESKDKKRMFNTYTGGSHEWNVMQ